MNVGADKFLVLQTVSKHQSSLQHLRDNHISIHLVVSQLDGIQHQRSVCNDLGSNACYCLRSAEPLGMTPAMFNERYSHLLPIMQEEAVDKIEAGLNKYAEKQLETAEK